MKVEASGGCALIIVSIILFIGIFISNKQHYKTIIELDKQIEIRDSIINKLNIKLNETKIIRSK